MSRPLVAPEAPRRHRRYSEPTEILQPFWLKLRKGCNKIVAFYTPDDIFELEDRYVLTKLLQFYNEPHIYPPPHAIDSCVLECLSEKDKMYCECLYRCILERLFSLVNL